MSPRSPMFGEATLIGNAVDCQSTLKGFGRER
jgi:hypothetical protein